MSRNKIDQNNLGIHELTKSEILLSKIGQEVECGICHNKVVMGRNWTMTAKRDKYGEFYDKKAVCPNCRPTIERSGALLVNI